ncbi:MAG: Signal recognition particle receptor FtsY [Verrucomicrobiales bacterium]|jgi:fused signal recognition particle receptor|nr:Signal recognition particle receptor FtsY [Verrucomicrobiales bacterium]MDB6131115.1 Signal recognition particle receptor FtsY [Verrucomicrobiales bacterium]
MGIFDKFRQGLQKTHDRLTHEIKRIVTRSPRLDAASIEELEAVLIGADLGVAMTQQIIVAAKKNFELQGKEKVDFLTVATREVASVFKNGESGLKYNATGLTVVSMVGVNGTGKTTTCAKLAAYYKQKGNGVVLAACDTFRAAAIDQLKIWGTRLDVPVVAGADRSDPSSVAHDAVTAALARDARYLFVDTAGRLHTKSNLMQELQKLHRVIGKKLPGAPHEVLLVLDASTGMNALNQAREFHKSVPLTGLVVSKLDGTSKGGMVVAIQKELGIPIRFIGLGEQPEDLQPFDAGEYAAALFTDRN